MKAIKATKKPVTIEAMEFKGRESIDVILSWLDDHDAPAVSSNGLCEIVIKTLEGNMKVSKGDFIIKGVQGESYPCKPDIFHATYDLS